ncbi:hypothetical protein WJX81_003150 [Elliptochloris bilobata]|uniref:C2H2-type domain-containing protein n=1 Tax=Elliptochloris bilobata TaxID=381761 RepID=A0AAW1RZP6_9CHLO
MQQLQQAYVSVPACGCSAWCQHTLALPQLDWGAVFGEVAMDPLIAIDLEWRPDIRTSVAMSGNPVALLQLASARMALLVRTCRMSFKLPPELASFLRDPSITLVGFAWNGGDEGKMTGTFGLGRKDFGCFLDLQEVALALGYNNIGLRALSHRVLGANMPKSSSVTTSNWGARQGLTAAQVSYGALDVLVAGQVLRGLRLWHSSPSPCASCRKPLGAQPACPPLKCEALGCKKRFSSASALISHGQSLGHRTSVALCEACGRHT